VSKRQNGSSKKNLIKCYNAIILLCAYLSFTDLQLTNNQMIHRTPWHFTHQCPLYPLAHSTFIVTLLVGLFNLHVCYRVVVGFQLNEYIHGVSEKTVQNCFCQNFVKFQSILVIVGR